LGLAPGAPRLARQPGVIGGNELCTTTDLFKA